ncbi:hypothetical protein OBBRIDRAFT_549584 [Obba rivulosa]|uniref:Heterokaryon incompatibility domain-containing protein n=1 Tax=Obba rivulosa TaxID=1052685 RepID=A0A8E2DK58_9APHY|nr:hypothetical protein OBBRIDRAFT_549584 [Obba rivulosa]
MWADGLGGTTEAGFPTCQLRCLAALTSQVLPGAASRMDALCVPGQIDVRKRAIGLMSQTYRDAAVVLVIDSDIRSCSINLLLEERQLRIATSAWMQRPWTLQEALFAEYLVFEFFDRLLGISALLAPKVEDTMTNPALFFLAGQLVRLTPGRVHEVDAGPGVLSLQEMAAQVQGRITSKPEDETLAISSPVSADAFQLINILPDQRMKTLLLKVRDIPYDIPFLNGPKIDEPGFQWAPATFMHAQGSPMGKMGSLEYSTLSVPQRAFWRATIAFILAT